VEPWKRLFSPRTTNGWSRPARLLRLSHVNRH
jgi:hypothetical protein